MRAGLQGKLLQQLVGCNEFGRPQSFNPGQGEGDRFSFREATPAIQNAMDIGLPLPLNVGRNNLIDRKRKLKPTN
jgi:hypothetical protein